MGISWPPPPPPFFFFAPLRFKLENKIGMIIKAMENDSSYYFPSFVRQIFFIYMFMLLLVIESENNRRHLVNDIGWGWACVLEKVYRGSEIKGKMKIFHSIIIVLTFSFGTLFCDLGVLLISPLHCGQRLKRKTPTIIFIS